MGPGRGEMREGFLEEEGSESNLEGWGERMWKWVTVREATERDGNRVTQGCVGEAEHGGGRK